MISPFVSRVRTAKTHAQGPLSGIRRRRRLQIVSHRTQPSTAVGTGFTLANCRATASTARERVRLWAARPGGTSGEVSYVRHALHRCWVAQGERQGPWGGDGDSSAPTLLQMPTKRRRCAGRATHTQPGTDLPMFMRRHRRHRRRHRHHRHRHRRRHRHHRHHRCLPFPPAPPPEGRAGPRRRRRPHTP